MGNRIRLAVYGLLVWLVPFAVAMAAFAIRESWRSLFESVMAVTVAAVTTALACDYLHRLPAPSLGIGLAVGLTWAAISIAVDLPLMLPPPISMSPGEYLADVGLTYLMIPAIAAGLGYAFERGRRV